MKDKVITLRIETTLGALNHDFDHTAKIADVVQFAVSTRGFQGNFALIYKGEELKPERTVESYHMQDNDVVTLAGTGDSY